MSLDTIPSLQAIVQQTFNPVGELKIKPGATPHSYDIEGQRLVAGHLEPFATTLKALEVDSKGQEIFAPPVDRVYLSAALGGLSSATAAVLLKMIDDGPLPHIILSVADILSLVGKILEKEKFDDTKAAAKFGQMLMDVALQGKDLDIAAAKDKVVAATMEFAGAMAGLGATLGSAAVTAKDIKQTKQENEKLGHLEDKHAADKSKFVMESSEYKNETDPKKKQAMLDETPLPMNQQQKTKLKELTQQHEADVAKWKQDDADFKKGATVASSPATAGTAATPPVPPRMTQEHKDLKSHEDFDDKTRAYESEKHNIISAQATRSKQAETVSGIYSSLGQNVSKSFSALGTMMTAVDIATKEGQAKVLQTLQGLFQSLIQNLSSDRESADKLLGDLRQLVISMADLQTQLTQWNR